MAKSKVSRKKLLKEPDEFITFTGRLIQFIQEYSKHLIGGLAILFVIIAIVSSVRYVSAKNEAEASLLLAQAQKRYAEALSAGTAEDAFKKVETDFKEILEQYPRKNAGKQARLIFADICYDAEKIDKAIELYKTSLDDWKKFPAINNIVLNSLAYAFEKKKEFKTALTYYEKIISSNDPNQKDFAIYNSGRIYAKLGDKEKSINAFKSVEKKYPGFIYNQIVKEKINS